MGSHHRLSVTRLVVLISLASWACNSSSTSIGPTPIRTGIEGTWSGTASDASGPGHMVWRLSQSGSSFSGTASLLEDMTSLVGHGTITGTVEAGLVGFTLTIPAGGFDLPYQSCLVQLTGTARLTATRLVGDFAGSNSCSGPVTGGQFTLEQP